MTELILKKDIDEEKLNTLLNFLNSWGVEVEVQSKSKKNQLEKNRQKRHSLFQSDFGMTIPLMEQHCGINLGI